MTSLVQQFKEYLHQVGYSHSTQKMLPALVGEFIHQQGITDITLTEQHHVKSFYEYLHTRPLKRRSGALSEMMISHYVYALKTFFAWLVTSGQSDHNPVSGLRFKTPRQNVRHPLATTEVRQLFAATVTLKEKALLHLFYSLGLRRSEGESLHSCDIHFKEQLLYVRRGKGARRRVVPMTATVAGELEAYYLEERCGSAVRKVKDEDAFLVNSAGGRMTGSQCNQLLKKIAERAALTGAITLHHLRHSIATHLLQGGMSLEYVRDFLGHSHLETTQIYAKVHHRQIRQL